MTGSPAADPRSSRWRAVGVWPTGVSPITLLLAVVLGMISLRSSNSWLLLIACALLAPIAISALLHPDLHSLSVTFSAPDRVAVGGSSKQFFRVHNGGRRSTPALLLTHSTRGFAPITIAVPGLPPG